MRDVWGEGRGDRDGREKGKEGYTCMKAISLGRAGEVVAAISCQEVGSELNLDLI